ncbi:peptidase [Aureococcus anophagefferens]|nr:peptidase [Aureococcus anophagefferens]
MLAFNSSDAPPPAPPRPTLTEKSFGDDDDDAGAPYYERSLQVDAAARQRRYDDEDAASARLAGGAAALACVFVVGGVALSFHGAGHALLAAALLGALGACGACVVACCGALGPALDDGGPVEEPAWYFRRRSARRLRRDARGALRRVSRDGEEELAPGGGEDDVDDRHGLREVRAQVDRVLAVVRPGDEAVVLVESPGGEVSAVGAVAGQIRRPGAAGDVDRENSSRVVGQIARLRRATRATACVDAIAASGGYMAAVVRAAPFALVGSVGVVSYVPNVQRLCERARSTSTRGPASRPGVPRLAPSRGAHGGSDKRTVDVVGVVTPEDERKAREELRLIHDVFKSHCVKYRPRLADDIDSLASGAAWLGAHALSLGLVDAVDTSDDYLARLERAAGVPRGLVGETALSVGGRATEVFDVVREKPKGP